MNNPKANALKLVMLRNILKGHLQMKDDEELTCLMQGAVQLLALDHLTRSMGMDAVEPFVKSAIAEINREAGEYVSSMGIEPEEGFNVQRN